MHRSSAQEQRVGTGMRAVGEKLRHLHREERVTSTRGGDMRARRLRGRSHAPACRCGNAMPMFTRRSFGSADAADELAQRTRGAAPDDEGVRCRCARKRGRALTLWDAGSACARTASIAGCVAPATGPAGQVAAMFVDASVRAASRHRQRRPIFFFSVGVLIERKRVDLFTAVL